MAQAAVLMRTSPAFGSASSTVSTVRGLPNARQTAALVCMDDPVGTAQSDDAPKSRARSETSSAVLRRSAIIFVGRARRVESVFLRRLQRRSAPASNRQYYSDDLDPAPAADAAAPIPPATPDAAPRAPSAATRQVLPDNDRLSLVDPVVEGARRRSSSGIAPAATGITARPAAATAPPNRIPRVNARRSIILIERFLR